MMQDMVTEEVITVARVELEAEVIIGVAGTTTTVVEQPTMCRELARSQRGSMEGSTEAEVK
jgi:hypothetical protein